MPLIVSTTDSSARAKYFIPCVVAWLYCGRSTFFCGWRVRQRLPVTYVRYIAVVIICAFVIPTQVLVIVNKDFYFALMHDKARNLRIPLVRVSFWQPIGSFYPLHRQPPFKFSRPQYCRQLLVCCNILRYTIRSSLFLLCLLNLVHASIRLFL
jgi:hypothetical protein